MEYFQDIKGLSTEELENLLVYENEQLEASLDRLGQDGLKGQEEVELNTEVNSYHRFIEVIEKELEVRKQSQSGKKM